MSITSKLLSLMIMFTSLSCCAKNLSDKDIDNAVKFKMWFDNGSVAPECQESVTYTVTNDSIICNIHHHNGSSNDGYAVSKQDMETFRKALKACKISKRSKAHENLCCGGHQIGLTIYSQDEVTFSASAYCGGGEMGGKLVCNEMSLKACFDALLKASKDPLKDD